MRSALLSSRALASRNATHCFQLCVLQGRYLGSASTNNCFVQLEAFGSLMSGPVDHANGPNPSECPWNVWRRGHERVTATCAQTGGQSSRDRTLWTLLSCKCSLLCLWCWLHGLGAQR
jgi:hypothetical protein